MSSLKKLLNIDFFIWVFFYTRSHFYMPAGERSRPFFTFFHFHPPTNIQEHSVYRDVYHIFSYHPLCNYETHSQWDLPTPLKIVFNSFFHWCSEIVVLMSLIIFFISKCWCVGLNSYRTINHPCVVKRMHHPTALAFSNRLFKNIHLKISFLKLILDYYVYICEFHREQAWGWWLNAIKNSARIIKGEMLCKFWRIARSRTEKEFKNAIDDLRICEQWKSGYAKAMDATY